jgi:hypothetical protein
MEVRVMPFHQWNVVVESKVDVTRHDATRRDKGMGRRVDRELNVLEVDIRVRDVFKRVVQWHLSLCSIKVWRLPDSHAS